IEANQYICMLKRNIPSDHFVPLVSKMVLTYIGTSIKRAYPVCLYGILLYPGVKPMVMTVTQKAVAILALIFFVLLADFIVILGVSVKMREALNNAIDGAVMVNLDGEP